MSLFGPLVGPGNLEAATIALLHRWMPTYLAEIERINELEQREIPRPPAPESLYGGIDFLSYQQDLLPSLVTVIHPTGETERSASIGYSQWYEVQIGALVQADDEDTARWFAGLYGAAVMGAVTQGGYTEDFVQSVTMVGAPDCTFPDEDERRLIVCVTTFHVLAGPIVDAGQGPAVPDAPSSPQYGGDPEAPFNDWPTVETTAATVSTTPL